MHLTSLASEFSPNNFKSSHCRFTKRQSSSIRSTENLRTLTSPNSTTMYGIHVLILDSILGIHSLTNLAAFMEEVGKHEDGEERLYLDQLLARGS